MIKFEGLGPADSPAVKEEYLRQLKKAHPAACVILATCDRIEVYTDDPGGDGWDREIVHHLFRVASGLESPFLGEQQILGQVRDAYLAAVKTGKATSRLHVLFQSALRAARFVRNGSGISRGAVSHSQAVFELVRSEISGSPPLRIAVIGINAITRSILRYLVRWGAQEIFLGNRTFDKAARLAEETGCSAFRLDQTANLLETADVLITAAACTEPLVLASGLPAAGSRKGRILMIDLGMPRNIQPSVSAQPGVTLYGLREIESRVLENRKVRAGIVSQAEVLVRLKVEDFFDRLRQRERYIGRPNAPVRREILGYGV